MAQLLDRPPLRPPLLVRPATEADLPAILQLVAQVVPLMRAAGNQQWSADYPNEAVFRQDIERAQLWIAEDGGAVVAVAALTMDQDPEYADADWEPGAPAIVTHRLAVAPEAAALLAQAETLARARGLNRLRVDTNSENTATQRLFPKLGYRFAGEIGLRCRPGLRFFCYEKLL